MNISKRDISEAHCITPDGRLVAKFPMYKNFPPVIKIRLDDKEVVFEEKVGHNVHGPEGQQYFMYHLKCEHKWTVLSVAKDKTRIECSKCGNLDLIDTPDWFYQVYGEKDAMGTMKEQIKTAIQEDEPILFDKLRTEITIITRGKMYPNEVRRVLHEMVDVMEHIRTTQVQQMYPS